ncbi:hypothetical protein PanWU01x14_139090 [Parasponia andersonii]|uniref:Uncharacterized protein n=1 Tax=Parasponia andersonii TaxID=3476 RepID=A0A2P5CMW1_PARAD|nr:hypothetical protein PanWU01x14_139090 [Parasponia andersonii]
MRVESNKKKCVTRYPPSVRQHSLSPKAQNRHKRRSPKLAMPFEHKYKIELAFSSLLQWRTVAMGLQRPGLAALHLPCGEPLRRT